VDPLGVWNAKEEEKKESGSAKNGENNNRTAQEDCTSISEVAKIKKGTFRVGRRIFILSGARYPKGNTEQCRERRESKKHLRLTVRQWGGKKGWGIEGM